MKYLAHLVVAALICLVMAPTTYADTTIYLVRHAEKQKDGTRNPPLTKTGAIRAETLANMLAGADLKAVYSTDYKRTQETAAPSAKMAGLPIKSYNPSALKEFAETLKTKDTSILVVGHSNTTPVLVNLLAKTDYPLLEEYQYDHLYVVTISQNGTAEAAISYIKPRTP